MCVRRKQREKTYVRTAKCASLSISLIWTKRCRATWLDLLVSVTAVGEEHVISQHEILFEMLRWCRRQNCNGAEQGTSYHAFRLWWRITIRCMNTNNAYYINAKRSCKYIQYFLANFSIARFREICFCFWYFLFQNTVYHPTFVKFYATEQKYRHHFPSIFVEKLRNSNNFRKIKKFQDNWFENDFSNIVLLINDFAPLNLKSNQQLRN